MPHPAGTISPDATARGWGEAWGLLEWGGDAGTGGVVGGQVVRRRIGWARGEQLITTTVGPRVVKL